MVRNGVYLNNRYDVISLIGSGGMADVYKARDTKLNRYVAIKILKEEFNDDIHIVKKFRQEAKDAAILKHPNIVDIYDVIEENGVNYIVMEFIQGITLKKFIEKRERLNYREAISIAIQVAKGIEIAGKNNIVHRDIKPQNIIISQDGKVKVADFGIAKAVSSNTISYNCMGSVHYISPEQARGGYFDFKSDIYSFGITLYEMVTGHVPFDGDNTVSIVVKHLQKEIIKPSYYVKDIPKALENIILKCTKKSPKYRYSDVTSLINDLKRCLNDPDGDFVNVNNFDDIDENIDSKMFTTEEKKKLNELYNKNNKKVNKSVNKINKIVFNIIIVLISSVLMFCILNAFKDGKIKCFFGFVSGKKYCKVPNVIGLKYRVARKKLNKKGFGILKKDFVYSNKYDVNEIISQTPKYGKYMKKNTTVKVVVSLGKKKKIIRMPDIVGLPKEDAINILDKIGMKFSILYKESDKEKDIVIEQSIKEYKKVKKGTRAIITISKGEEMVVSPDIIGTTESYARNAIVESGLKIGEISRVYNEEVSKGIVIKQSINPGEKVKSGRRISFVISMGSRDETIEQ